MVQKGRSYKLRQTGVWTGLQLIGACGHVEELESPLLVRVGNQNTINKYLGSLSTRGLEKRRRNERGRRKRDGGVWWSRTSNAGSKGSLARVACVYVCECGRGGHTCLIHVSMPTLEPCKTLPITEKPCTSNEGCTRRSHDDIPYTDTNTRRCCGNSQRPPASR